MNLTSRAKLRCSWNEIKKKRKRNENMRILRVRGIVREHRVSCLPSILLGLLIRHTYFLSTDTSPIPRGTRGEGRKCRGRERRRRRKVEAHSRARVVGGVSLNWANAAKPVRGFRTAGTTAARHVVAATLTNSSAFVVGHRLIRRLPNTTANRDTSRLKIEVIVGCKKKKRENLKNVLAIDGKP